MGILRAAAREKVFARRGIGSAISEEDTVNAVNPFQLPPCLERGVQRRREQVRTIFFVIMAAHAILFGGLLIQGCQSRPTMTSAGSDGYPAILVKLQSQAE